jgi:hypothetical protein
MYKNYPYEIKIFICPFDVVNHHLDGIRTKLRSEKGQRYDTKPSNLCNYWKKSTSEQTKETRK